MSRRSIVIKDSLLPHSHQPNCSCCDDTEKFHKRASVTSLVLIWCRSYAKACPSALAVLAMFSFSLQFITLDRALTGQFFRSDRILNSPYNFHQPRIAQVNLNLDSVSTIRNFQKSSSTREVLVSGEAKRAQKALTNSKKYNQASRDPLREGDCQPMQWWQETSFPSCNKMHEMHMEKQFKFIAAGGYNSVFRMKDIDDLPYVVKILEYESDHTDRNFDRVRRDSLIMERASFSPYVVDIYSFCGFAQVVEYGREGNLDHVVFDDYEDVTSAQKLQVATQVTSALAAVHNLDGDGISSMSHGDFATKQYILINGIFKLNDFNRGRFIRWNPKKKEPCTYTIGSNDAKFRAPEEYQYIPETAAIDVWALGSIFVELVTGKGVWHKVPVQEAQKRIAKGELPKIPDKIKTSTDPVDKILLKAIDMCYVIAPKDRPKPGQVLEYLKNESKRLNVDWQAPFKLQSS